MRHDEYAERAVGGISLSPGGTRSGVTVVLRRGLAVRGVVKDEDGRPLAGAEVNLSSARTVRAGRGGVQMSFIGPGSQLRRETGADGRFEFRGLKAGDYTVSARRPGFSRATVDPVNVAEARAAEPLELVLKPGATISGVLRDKAGAGASGWSVSARAASQGGGPAFGPGAIRSEEPTGPDGVFFLEGLHRGRDLRAAGHGAGRPRAAQGGRRGAGGGRGARSSPAPARSAGASWTATAAARSPTSRCATSPTPRAGCAS